MELLYILDANAAAGSSVIHLSNRVGLSAGQVIRIGSAPNDEHITIGAVPSRAAVGADPGNLLLDHPLQRAHTAGGRVWVKDAAQPGLHPSSTVVLDVPRPVQRSWW